MRRQAEGLLERPAEIIRAEPDELRESGANHIQVQVDLQAICLAGMFGQIARTERSRAREPASSNLPIMPP